MTSNDSSYTYDLLNGSWVVVAGDSQAKLVTLALLQLVLESHRTPSVKSDLFRRHIDYQIKVNHLCSKLDFIWAPMWPIWFSLSREIGYPNALVMGSGLWAMAKEMNVKIMYLIASRNTTWVWKVRMCGFGYGVRVQWGNGVTTELGEKRWTWELYELTEKKKKNYVSFC